jgi:hypothetical protein
MQKRNKEMGEFSNWFKQTFKNCYCEKGHLIDEERFEQLVQLVLDGEADEQSKKIFEEKISTCVKSSFTYEKEKKIQEQIKSKLCAHQSELPSDLIQTIRKSVNL